MSQRAAGAGSGCDAQASPMVLLYWPIVFASMQRLELARREACPGQ